MSFHPSAIDNGDPCPEFLLKRTGEETYSLALVPDTVAPPDPEDWPSVDGNYARLKKAVDQAEAELTRDKISQIAELTGSLTYGEMMELAEGIWGAREGEITAESLPGVLHRWATR